MGMAISHEKPLKRRRRNAEYVQLRRHLAHGRGTDHLMVLSFVRDRLMKGIPICRAAWPNQPVATI